MTTPMHVTDNAAAGRFEVTLDGAVAFAEYRLEPGRIVLPHTVVPEAFAGRGVGGALAKAAFGYARAHRLEVVPTCEFMAGWVKKHPDEHDLLTESSRTALGIP